MEGQPKSSENEMIVYQQTVLETIAALAATQPLPDRVGILFDLGEVGNLASGVPQDRLKLKMDEMGLKMGPLQKEI
jgi:hypothetical protein